MSSPKKATEGTIFSMGCGSEIEVLSYQNAKTIQVQFTDRFSKPFNAGIGNLRKGKYKNPYQPSVCGVGFIGEGCFNTSEHQRAYKHWSYMISKCYNTDYRLSRHVDKDTFVCDDWLNFQNFAGWFYARGNHNNLIELDKDLLYFGNRMYCPEKCVLIPREINTKLPKSSSSLNFTKKGNSYKCWFTDASGKRGSKGSVVKENTVNFLVSIWEEKVEYFLEKYKYSLCNDGRTALHQFPSKIRTILMGRHE